MFFVLFVLIIYNHTNNDNDNNDDNNNGRPRRSAAGFCANRLGHIHIINHRQIENQLFGRV